MTSLYLVIAFMVGVALGFVAGELDAVEQMLDVVQRYADALGLPREGRPSLTRFLSTRRKDGGNENEPGNHDRAA